MRITFIIACLAAASYSMSVLEDDNMFALTDYEAVPADFAQWGKKKAPARGARRKPAGRGRGGKRPGIAPAAAKKVGKKAQKPGFFAKALAKVKDMAKDMPALKPGQVKALIQGGISTAAAIPQAMAGNPMAMFTVGKNAFNLGKGIYNYAKEYKANRKKRTGKDDWFIQRVHGSELGQKHGGYLVQAVTHGDMH